MKIPEIVWIILSAFAAACVLWFTAIAGGAI